MWNPTDRWMNQGSYVEPVAIPASDPNDPPYICVQFNQDWQPYICGALQQLAQPSTWVAPSPAALQAVLIAAQELVETFGIATPCAVSCQGMDPAFQSTFTLKTGSNSVINTLHVTAGRTKGGLPRIYSATDLTITGPGLWVVSVSPGAVVQVTTAAAIPLGNIVIATLNLIGNGGLFHSSDWPTSVLGTPTYFTFDSSGSFPVTSFPSTASIALPQPAIIPSSAYNNASTPSGDTSGFWVETTTPGVYAPVNALQWSAVGNIPAYANPLAVVEVSVVTYDPTPTAATLTVNSLVNGVSAALASGVDTYMLPGSPTPWASGLSQAHNTGNPNYAPHASLGGPPLVGDAIAVSAPIATLTIVLSTC